MEQVETAVAESSPAEVLEQSFEVPKDQEAYQEWRRTGKLPEPPKKLEPEKKESAPSASAEESAETEAPSASAHQQEVANSKPQKRLDEILQIIKDAGFYGPNDLKTFRKQQATQQSEPAKPPETTSKPQGLEVPKRPKMADFQTVEEYETALEKYENDRDAWRDAVYEQRRQQEELTKSVNAKLADAKSRYGENTETVIGQTARTIFQDKAIPQAIKDVLNDSPVLVHLMYVMGTKTDDLQEFVDLAHSNPSAALRKAILLETLVQEELNGKSADAATEKPRNENGQFAKTPPAKPQSTAPPPPTELSTRGSAPPDEVAEAVRRHEKGDINAFAQFKEAEDRKALARKRGA